MYCIYCGKELPEDAQFCSRCGKTVTGEAGTYSYAYKRAKTADADKTPGSDRGSGTYSYAYKRANTPDPEITPGSNRKSEVKQAQSPKQETGGMGCCSWIVILVFLSLFYSWVLYPISKEKGWFGMSQSAAATEETQSPEELEKEERAARLPGIREEHQALPFFDSRQIGSCKTLEGNVGITVLFIDDAESSWTQEKMDEFIRAVYSVCVELDEEAALWGKELNFNVQSAQGTVAEVVEPELAYLSFNRHVSSAGYSSIASETLNQLRAQTYMDEVPVIVAFNKPGRSYANPANGEYAYVERCYIFDDISALKHEILHLFGAADFYYHDYLDYAAGEYLGDSVMASSDGPVDDMTAYLVGWTDSLTENANLFVYAGAAIGNEELLKAKQTNSVGGYATKTFDNGAVYTGTLSMGVPDGTGEIVWPNGDRYNGDWVQGHRTGYGILYWANGSVYEGEFLNDQIHGRGTLTYSNGQIQSGTWENGKFIG